MVAAHTFSILPKSGQMLILNRMKLNSSDKIDEIINVICSIHNVNVNAFFSKRRDRELVKCRQYFYYIARQVLKTTFIELGKKTNRDHSTVIYSIQQIENLLSINDSIVVNDLRKINDVLKF